MRESPLATGPSRRSAPHSRHSRTAYLHVKHILESGSRRTTGPAPRERRGPSTPPILLYTPRPTAPQVGFRGFSEGLRNEVRDIPPWGWRLRSGRPTRTINSKGREFLPKLTALTYSGAALRSDRQEQACLPCWPVFPLEPSSSCLENGPDFAVTPTLSSRRASRSANTLSDDKSFTHRTL